MTENRKELISKFQKLFDTHPNGMILAALCANIAENNHPFTKLELITINEDLYENLGRKVYMRDAEREIRIGITNKIDNLV